MIEAGISPNDLKELRKAGAVSRIELRQAGVEDTSSEETDTEETDFFEQSESPMEDFDTGSNQIWSWSSWQQFFKTFLPKQTKQCLFWMEQTPHASKGPFMNHGGGGAPGFWKNVIADSIVKKFIKGTPQKLNLQEILLT